MKENTPRHSAEYDPMRTESNLLFMVSWMSDLLIRDIEMRAKNHNSRLDRETKMMFNRYNNQTRLLTNYFDHYIDSFCINTLNVDEYERLRADANEIARVLLKYVEKTALYPENIDKIHSYMDSLPGAGLFTESDINRFNLNPR